LDAIRSAKSEDDIRNLSVDLSPLASRLSPGFFNIHLLGRAQIWTDVQGTNVGAQFIAPSEGVINHAPTNGRLAAVVLGEADFEPLPFDEAIDYFRRKLNLTPAQFAALSDAARAKAFTVAAGSNVYVRSSINDLLGQALSDGLTLKDFQNQAADVLDSAGLSARNPWYWETVYRTNLQTSYQVGRWKQMTDPDVVKDRPFLRYVSALLPTSRPSHVEKHGAVYPVGDSFWDTFYPPNGFNCVCTVVSVSESLLSRRGWTLSTGKSWLYDAPDEGFAGNAGKSASV